MTVPSNFNMPDFSAPEKWGKTAHGSDPRAPGAILRPVGGSTGSLFVEFVEVRELQGAESEEKGEEVYAIKEVLHVKTDRFSMVPIAVGKAGVRQDKAVLAKSIAHIESVHSESEEEEKLKKAAIAALNKHGVVSGFVRSELSPQMQRELAPLYERFKEQRGSTDASIYTWQAVNDADKGFLASLGIYTVEQLYHTPKERRAAFGPGGEELWERSERFMKAKQKALDTEERRAEMALIREEREAQAARIQAQEEKMLELQKQIAELTGKKK